MATRPKNSEAQMLEQYRVTLVNVENQKEIADTLAEFGYPSKTIEIGRKLLDKTNKLLDFNKKEDNETIRARADFDINYEKIKNKYSSHRKIAKVVFRKDDVVQKQLSLKGAIPRTYINWLIAVKTFYKEIIEDICLLNKLERFKITSEVAKSCLTDIAALETIRAFYLKEKGESQEATKEKDRALSELEEWMSEFYAVAKIAMEDRPQLLEALGLLVRG